MANYAAADSSLPPLYVLIQTRLNKGNRNESKSKNESRKEKIKDKNLSKMTVAKSYIASNQIQYLGTSKEIELRRIINNNVISWATVEHKGRKKDRVVQYGNAYVVIRNKDSQRVFHNDNSST